jgi:hypothetical protein
MLSHAVYALLAGAHAHGSAPLPTDCRNNTAPEYAAGGQLRVMSYHIHYNTIAADQQRFYEGFVAQFGALFNPSTYPGFEVHQCPFGPNYGSNSFDYVCSLEGPYQEHSVGVGEGPWAGPQRAFFIPDEHIDAAWAWAQANKGVMDVLKHPNTGCMHDDHSLRANWDSTLRDLCDAPLADDDEAAPVAGCNGTCAAMTARFDCADYFAPGKAMAGLCDKTCGFAPSNPTISILNFPCNVPGSGCNDSIYPGPPSCGCTLPLPDDAPGHSCKGCIPSYVPPS